MPVPQPTKRTLWKDAGGICSFPFCYLQSDVGATTAGDPLSTISTVAHIVSGKDGGPRRDGSFPPHQIDALANLIHLCPTHHMLVDTQPMKYTADLVHRWKAEHEARVKKHGFGYFEKALIWLREVLQQSGAICASPDCRHGMPAFAPDTYNDTITLIDISGLPSLASGNLVVLCVEHKDEVQKNRQEFSSSVLRPWKRRREEEERESAEYDRQLEIDAD